VSLIVDLDLFKLAIILNRLRKIYSKRLTSGDDNDGGHPETSSTSPSVPPPTQQIPHIVSSIKLPILKKGEYDIWAMKMEHYLSHTDYPIWQGSSSYTDEVIHSFFVNQLSAPQLDYDDLEQINDDDMEEMDLKWKVAMISMRIKKFHKRIGRKL
nr:ribonuclease H-like domain-containing protein [Tanacetum cinerariifolium]